MNGLDKRALDRWITREPDYLDEPTECDINGHRIEEIGTEYVDEENGLVCIRLECSVCHLLDFDVRPIKT